MVEIAHEQLRWRKSRASGTTNCLEVATVDQGVLVRDSKDPNGPWLWFPSHQWLSFLDAVKQGDFDE